MRDPRLSFQHWEIVKARDVIGTWAGLLPVSLLCRLLAVLLLVGSTPTAAQQYSVEEATLNGGGGTVTANGLEVTSSFGGASPVGTARSEQYVLYSGIPSPFPGRRPIVVVHEPDEEGEPLEAGSEYTVTARIVSNVAPLEEATLFYRTGADSAATEVEMTETDEGFTATIPAEAIGASGIAYYFVATNERGSTVREPSSGIYSLPVALDGSGIRKSDGLPGGTTQADYRLLSMPLVLEDPRPQAVLGDDIEVLSSESAYDPSEARFFEPINTGVSEFPRTSDFEIGKAFWLIVREGVEEISTGPGTVMALDEPVEIDLIQGWNFIGTPFTAEVPVSNVYTEGETSVELRSYDSEGYNTPEDPVQSMQPFEGYALYTEEEETLIIEPPEGDDASSTQSKSTSSPFSWRLRVRATSSIGKDLDNVAAVQSGASEGWGSEDWAEPPALFGRLRVAFDPPEEAPEGLGLSADVRPELVRGATWPLTIRADTSGPVNLAVEGVEQVPSNFEVRLLDTRTKMRWDLREKSDVHLDLLADKPERSFQLLVGTEEYVAEHLKEQEAFAEDYVLEPPSPNPSTGPVAIRFGLPAEETVSLSLYNILGQKVAQLRDGVSMEAGYHTITWDGRVGSGVYFIRLEAGSFQSAQKMVRMR